MEKWSPIKKKDVLIQNSANCYALSFDNSDGRSWHQSSFRPISTTQNYVRAVVCIPDIVMGVRPYMLLMTWWSHVLQLAWITFWFLKVMSNWSYSQLSILFSSWSKFNLIFKQDFAILLCSDEPRMTPTLHSDSNA